MIEARCPQTILFGVNLPPSPQPLIARIESDRVVIDLRTVFEEQDEPLADALVALT